jgi:hypothetical protein
MLRSTGVLSVLSLSFLVGFHALSEAKSRQTRKHDPDSAPTLPEAAAPAVDSRPLDYPAYVESCLAPRHGDRKADLRLAALHLNLLQYRQRTDQVAGPDGVRRQRGEPCYRATARPCQRR